MKNHNAVTAKIVALPTTTTEMDDAGYPTGRLWRRLNSGIISFLGEKSNYRLEDFEEVMIFAPWFRKGLELYAFAFLDCLTGTKYINKAFYIVNETCPNDLKLRQGHINPQLIDRLIEELIKTYCETQPGFRQDMESTINNVIMSRNYVERVNLLKNFTRRHSRNPDNCFKCNYFIGISAPIGLTYSDLPNPGIDNSTQILKFDDKVIKLSGKLYNIFYIFARKLVNDFCICGKQPDKCGYISLGKEMKYNDRVYNIGEANKEMHRLRKMLNNQGIVRNILETAEGSKDKSTYRLSNNPFKVCFTDVKPVKYIEPKIIKLPIRTGC